MLIPRPPVGVAAVELAAVLLACLALLAPATPVRADGGWQMVYSHAGTNISSIAMADDEHGLAIAGAGILRTDDGGATWTEASGQPALASGQIAFADPQHAWAATLSGGIWRTDDGGLTWTPQQSGTDAHMNALAVISADEAWVTALGEGFSDVGPIEHPASVLLHTVDAGRIWQPVTVAGFGQFYDVAFAGTHGWLVASRCHPGDAFGAPPTSPPTPGCDDTRIVITSEDAGRSWVPIAPQPPVLPDSLRFFDAMHGLGTSNHCAGSDCREELFVTDDGGKTWTPRDSGPGSVMTFRFRTPLDGRLSLLDCTHGCTTRLARTTDGGATFQYVDVPSRPGVTGPSLGAFDVTSTSVVGAFGPTGIERYELTSGMWTPATTDARPALSSLVFVTPDRGYALDQGSASVLRTDDGGATWTPRPAPADFFALAATPTAVWGLAGGDPAERVFRSTDGAVTWAQTTIPPGIGAVPLSLQAEGDRAWLLSDAGFWRSDDGGASWRELPRPDGPTGFTFIDRDHGFAYNCDGPGCPAVFTVTDDGGATSEQRPLPPLAAPVFFVTPDIGWATARDSAEQNGYCPCTFHLYGTTDGGRSWQELQSGQDSYTSLTFIDPLHGWAVRQPLDSAERQFVSSSDGGRTWQADPGLQQPLPIFGGGTFLGNDGRIWLITGVSFNPFEGGRTDIYRRDITASPNVLPPNTGSGATASDPGGADGLETALLGLGGLLLAGAGCWLRRRRATLA